MVVREYPYIDRNGKARKDLVKFYSDKGLRLKQVDTGNIYKEFAVDKITVHHTYIEIEEDKGDLPEEQREPEPVEEAKAEA